jgi:hypothetical protein
MPHRRPPRCCALHTIPAASQFPGPATPGGHAPNAVAAWFEKLSYADYTGERWHPCCRPLSSQAWSRRATAANTRRGLPLEARALVFAARSLPPPRHQVRRRRVPRRRTRPRGLGSNTLDLRRDAIRYLHHAAGCASPTGDGLVGETLAGIRRTPLLCSDLAPGRRPDRPSAPQRMAVAQ